MTRPVRSSTTPLFGREKRLFTPPPAIHIQRISTKVSQGAHLVVLGPAASARVDNAAPPAIRRLQPLRALQNAMIARPLPALLRPQQTHRPAHGLDGLAHLDNPQLLHQIAEARVVLRPAGVDGEAAKARDLEHRRVDGPLPRGEAAQRASEVPGGGGGRRVLRGRRAAQHVRAVRLVAAGRVLGGEDDVPAAVQRVQLGRPEAARVGRVGRRAEDGGFVGGALERQQVW